MWYIQFTHLRPVLFLDLASTKTVPRGAVLGCASTDTLAHIKKKNTQISDAVHNSNISVNTGSTAFGRGWSLLNYQLRCCLCPNLLFKKNNAQIKERIGKLEADNVHMAGVISL